MCKRIPCTMHLLVHEGRHVGIPWLSSGHDYFYPELLSHFYNLLHISNTGLLILGGKQYTIAPLTSSPSTTMIQNFHSFFNVYSSVDSSSSPLNACNASLSIYTMSTIMHKVSGCPRGTNHSAPQPHPQVQVSGLLSPPSSLTLYSLTHRPATFVHTLVRSHSWTCSSAARSTDSA